MKKVFSNNYDCVHTFAQRTQNEGRTQNGNIFFEGDKIYSYGYHYELGRFLDEKTILINDRGYSNSTAKHINILMGASRQYKQYYHTQTNLDYIYRHVFNYLKPKLQKARKPQIYLRDIYSLWGSLNQFIDEQRKQTSTKKIKEYKELKKFVLSLQNNEATSLENLKKSGLLGAISFHSFAKQQKERQKKMLKEKLQKFLSYEINYFNIGKKDYLRISKDNTNIETSQGVKIDIKEAKRYLQLLNKGVNMRGEKIDNFVTRSFENNLLSIGCHNIDISEINKISKLI